MLYLSQTEVFIFGIIVGGLPWILLTFTRNTPRLKILVIIFSIILNLIAVILVLLGYVDSFLFFWQCVGSLMISHFYEDPLRWGGDPGFRII